MECILVFASFGEGEPLAGERGGGAGSSPAACWLEVESGPGEALTPSVLSFLPLRPIQTGNPKGVIECHALGHTFQCPNVSQLRPGLDTTGGSSHGPGGSFLPAHILFLLQNSVCLPLSSTRALSSLLSLRVPPPFPSLSIQLASKRKPFSRGGGLLSCLHLRCCRFES